MSQVRCPSPVPGAAAARSVAPAAGTHIAASLQRPASTHRPNRGSIPEIYNFAPGTSKPVSKPDAARTAMNAHTDDYSTLRTEVLDLQKQRLALLSGTVLPVGAVLAWLLDRRDWSWPFAAMFPLGIIAASTVLVLFTTRWIVVINTYLEATRTETWNHHVTLFSRKRRLPRFGWAVCGVNLILATGSVALLSIQCRGETRHVHWIGFASAAGLLILSNALLVFTYKKSTLLNTWRSVLRRPSLLLVAGPGASGKTYVAERLGRQIPGAVLLDKDTLAEKFTDKLLALAGESSSQRDSEKYTKEFRPLEYDALLSVAKQNLQIGRTVLAVAPFSFEVTNDRWLRHIETDVPAGVVVRTVWVSASPEAIKNRMAQRNAAYDAQKLADWGAWESKLKALPVPTRRANLHFITNDVDEEGPVQTQIDDLVRKLCLT